MPCCGSLCLERVSGSLSPSVQDGLTVCCSPASAAIVIDGGHTGAAFWLASTVMTCVWVALSPAVALWACHVNVASPCVAPAV